MCNRHLLVDVLWACCTQNYSNNGQPPGAATADPETPPPPPRGSPHLTPSETCISHTTGRALALLLIELVAPDVMYNGILWLEEDFMKVTVERWVIVFLLSIRLTVIQRGGIQAVVECLTLDWDLGQDPGSSDSWSCSFFHWRPG